MKTAAELGFKNVEMWLVDGSFGDSPDELARLAGEAGVRITNTVIGSPAGTGGGALTDPRNRAQWLERARMTLEFNTRAGIPATIVCTGNTVDGMTDDQMKESVIEGLKPTVDMAESSGVTLLLEPLNTTYDHAGYWLASSDRGAEICRALGSDRMRLLFDCYHMQIMEGDLVKHIERNIDVIGHFHSAGVPGRHELFQGEVNYPFVVGEIERLGYDGVFGLEYAPSMDDEASLKRTLEYLG
jgi:hydroxypyruvate isomerase